MQQQQQLTVLLRLLLCSLGILLVAGNHQRTGRQTFRTSVLDCFTSNSRGACVQASSNVFHLHKAGDVRCCFCPLSSNFESSMQSHFIVSGLGGIPCSPGSRGILACGQRCVRWAHLPSPTVMAAGHGGVGIRTRWHAQQHCAATVYGVQQDCWHLQQH